MQTKRNKTRRPGSRALAEIVPVINLPEGYRGKILLALVQSGKKLHVILRSGDLSHREILRNAQAEVRSLGLTEARVEELGGAQLAFREDGSIVIWGNSEDFGTCDREYVAELVRAAWPDRTVLVDE